MMESIALESNIAASAIIPNEDGDYVMVEDSDSDDDDAMEVDEDSYDMCDEEDDLLTSLSSPSPAPSFSTQELRDLETLVEGEEGPTPSIGIGATTTTNHSTNNETPAARGRSRVVSIVSEEDAYRRDDDDANAGVPPPALLSDLESSNESVSRTSMRDYNDEKDGPSGSSPSLLLGLPLKSPVPTDADLHRSEQMEHHLARSIKSRPSNKKRRKKIKMMKKAAAAAAAAAALSEMSSSGGSVSSGGVPPAAAAKPMTPTRHHKAKGAVGTVVATRKSTNLQVAVAAETLAQYRAEHGL
mmetsp:Transcript_12298/g.35186  ORF Transcript_12298/g.35186 Transcript_12298/m.35186 type:complete len:299 (+) Transcript_12298:97-993(+)